MTLVRKLAGNAPARPMPKGATDCQMHMYLPGFASAPGALALPAGVPGAEDYRKVMAWLGLSRVVITQGNAHGRDHGNLIACLGEMGDCARGVAAIGPDVSDAEMARLHDAGVRGARIMDLPGGATGMADLAAVDARAAAHGWTLAVQFDGSTILDQMAGLGALKSRFIIDHHGKFHRGAAPGSVEIDAVKSLIDRGNCWFKFAGCYEATKTSGPDYPDIASVARDIADFAPERLVWGTNWPHNMIRQTADYPDDAHLLDLAMDWAGSDEARRTMLVDSPARLFGFARA
jgi:D-galactarolactone isomerase